MSKSGFKRSVGIDFRGIRQRANLGNVQGKRPETGSSRWASDLTFVSILEAASQADTHEDNRLRRSAAARALMHWDVERSHCGS